jgi:chromosome segregation ATPase
MALPKMSAASDGWQSQTDYLTQTHTAVGIAMMAVADKARRRAPLALADQPEIAGAALEPAAPAESAAPAVRPERISEPPPPAAAPAELEAQLARKAAAIRVLSKHTNALSEQATAAERRVAELETELVLARESIDLRTNENFSFQNSFDLIVGENARLSSRLAENAATLDKAAAEIERLQRALHSAEVERNQLTVTAEQTHERQHAETAMLQTRLEAMSSRAAAAETMLAEAQQSLLAHSQANTRVETEVARLYDRATECRAAVDKAQSQLERTQSALRASETERGKLTSARDEASERHRTEIDGLHRRLEAMAKGAGAAEQMFAKVRESLIEKVEQLQNVLSAKDQQIQSLEQSRSQLIEGTNALLKNFSARDAALARAEATIKRLMFRVAELEAEAKLANNQELIEKLKRQLQGDGAARPVIIEAQKQAKTNGVELWGLPNREAKPIAEASAPAQKSSSAEILYANAITF